MTVKLALSRQSDGKVNLVMSMGDGDLQNYWKRRATVRKRLGSFPTLFKAISSR